MLVFILVVVLPLILSNKFMPTADISTLYNASASGADMTEMIDIYMGIITSFFTGNHVAMIVSVFLLCVLISSPAAVGAAAFFTQMFNGKSVKTVSVLHWYTNASLSLGAFLLVLLVILISGVSFYILTLIPYLALILLVGVNSAVAAFFFVVLYIVCVLCFLVIMLRFCLAVFVMAAYRCGAGKAISMALKITKKGAAIELFMFVLSFIVWIIACVFTFGVGLIFALPYLGLSASGFTKQLLYRSGFTPPPSAPNL